MTFLGSQNILWPLSHIFRGSEPQPPGSTPRLASDHGFSPGIRLFGVSSALQFNYGIGGGRKGKVGWSSQTEPLIRGLGNALRRPKVIASSPYVYNKISYRKQIAHQHPPGSNVVSTGIAGHKNVWPRPVAPPLYRVWERGAPCKTLPLTQCGHRGNFGCCRSNGMDHIMGWSPSVRPSVCPVQAHRRRNLLGRVGPPTFGHL